MISVELARDLADAGLRWAPTTGDRFFIPDRDLDEEVFSISDMAVDVRRVTGGTEIAFNGAVEWALDAIEQREVIWLPSEPQLREHLGERFVSLSRSADGYTCVARNGGEHRHYVAADASNAYGLALLDELADQAS